MCGLSTVVTPAGASLTMYREIRSYANSIWDDNNNNNIARYNQPRTSETYWRQDDVFESDPTVWNAANISESELQAA